MAITNSTQIDKTVLGTGVNDSNEVETKMLVSRFSYTTLGSETSGDVIKFASLPKGSRMYGGKIAHDDPNSGVFLSIGTLATPAGYAATFALSGTASTTFADTIATNINEAITVNSEYLAATLTAGTLSAGQTFEGSVQFAI